MRLALFAGWPDTDLRRRLTERTLAVVRASGLACELWVTGAPIADFQAWLGDDIAIVDQGNGDLGARLARAATTLPVLLMPGADLPQLAPAHLLAAATAMARGASVIGPLENGGYWLLGLAEPAPGVFTAIDWGSDMVFAQTIARLPHPPRVLALLADCRQPEELSRWPGLFE